MITFKHRRNGMVSSSAFEDFLFPAGETHLRIPESLAPIEIAVVQFSPDSMHTDLFTLSMWMDVINQYRSTSKHQVRAIVVMPYFPGARADRGMPFGLSVYANHIGTIGADEIIIMDPHSKELFTQLNMHMRRIMTRIYYPEDFADEFRAKRYAGVIAPDKGAYDRALDFAIPLNVPLFTATKTRDFETGKLTGFKAPENLPKEGSLIIVDDICDGGGTFAGLSSAIYAERPDIGLDLFVSHGVFSGRAVETLRNSFNTVYTTNSFISENKDEVALSRNFVTFDIVSMMLDNIK